MIIWVLLIPIAAAAAFWAVRAKRWMHLINTVSAGILLILALLISSKVIQTGHITLPFLNNIFYLDALSVLMLDLILGVYFLVAVYLIGYLNEEYRQQVITLRRMKMFYSLTCCFIFSVILALTTQNLGIMWIAIEATTLSSALLVGLYNNREAVEAAWKYVIICSVGIALALLGIVFLYISAVNVFAESHFNLNWAFLTENATSLHGSILKIAFIFILVGYGTKAGLAPMHTWLPDAYTLSPSPISALLSGVLSSSAIYAVIRVLTIVNKNLGSNIYTGNLLIAVGIISVAAAAIFMLTQRDYKRLLAYSSIEHLGIITLGLGIFTPTAIFGSLFHILNHALTKSLLFLGAGSVHLKYKSREIGKVTGLLKALPITGIVFLLGLFAIAGTPPFSIFASEISIIISSFTANYWLAGAALVVFVAIVFTGIAFTALKMFYVSPTADPALSPSPGEPNMLGAVTILGLLLIIAITGIYLPGPVKQLLDSATRIVTSGVG
ncbi:MAG TPA: proton-conducting transporter membrane subunit [Bacillota bacterium]|nr:proton-conducting transporter membrane subunit [Bacillota bacterium]